MYCQEFELARKYESLTVRLLAELELDKASSLALPADMCRKELCFNVLTAIADANGSPIQELQLLMCSCLCVRSWCLCVRECVVFVLG